MQKRVLLLVNSVSGTNNGVSNLFTMLETLALHNCLVTVYPIVPEKNLVSENVLDHVDVSMFDVLACVGGDGTLNHLINQVQKRNIRIPIGYIPTGSTNDFSRSINQGRQLTIEEHCQTIAEGKIFYYDIGRYNNAYFNYVAAFGAFTNISYDTSQNLKNTLGYAAYVLNMITHLPDGLMYSVHAQFESDKMIGEGDFVFGAVSNTTSIAGVRSPLVEDSQLDDGLFEVTLIKAPKNIIDVNRILAKLGAGESDDEYIIRFTTDKIRFHFTKEVTWTLDGEESETNNRAEITCLKKAVGIYVQGKAA